MIALAVRIAAHRGDETIFRSEMDMASRLIVPDADIEPDRLLLHDHHPEFTRTSELERGIYGRVTWEW